VFSKMSSLGIKLGYRNFPMHKNQSIQRQGNQVGTGASVTLFIKEWAVIEIVDLMAELIFINFNGRGEIPAPHSMLAQDKFFWRWP